uniref:Tubulin--tyrosine ligase-like protein 9 n=1 Tax=Strigamia maritima TaxID=126957 RepID=T1J1B7_STRMM
MSTNQPNSKSSSCTQTSHSLVPSPKPRYYEKFRQAKQFAEKAIRENRIFTIVGRYPYIRLALRKRGWVEKTYYGDVPSRPRRRRRRYTKPIVDSVGSNCSEQNDNKADKAESNMEGDVNADDSGSSDDDDSDGQQDNMRTVACSPTQQTSCDMDDIPQDDEFWENEDINSIMSRMVRKASPNFIWTCRRDCIYFKRIRKNQLVNHFPTADFTTKVGLCNCLQDLRWWAEVDVRNYFPRCYCIGVDEEKYAFIEDFRLSACLGIMKWVINFVQSTKITNFTLPLNCLHVPVRVGEVALQQCEAFLRCKNHEDIDADVSVPMSDDQWSVVLDWYYQLVHKNALMMQVETIHDKCLKMLKRMRQYWPQMELDGMNNVWIVKPGAKSRGIGIMILERLDDIINLVDSQVVVKTTKYVVQKYIERPFLIYNTKFDIRQWFMVTDWNPLTIYFYKDCYLRFCSRYFSLTDKSEAVHLCNNAVQRRYMHEERPSVLPRYAMWSSDEFKDFLHKRGKSLVWDKIIYPGMKEAVTASMIAAQDMMDAKKGCFELYGADFMLTENFHPWLLEINSSPCLAPTTQVTARLCSNVLDDAIKVLIDRRNDRNASIGEFECAFKQITLTMPPYIGVNLMVQGTAIQKPQNRFYEATFEVNQPLKLMQKNAPNRLTRQKSRNCLHPPEKTPKSSANGPGAPPDPIAESESLRTRLRRRTKAWCS